MKQNRNKTNQTSGASKKIALVASATAIVAATCPTVAHAQSAVDSLLNKMEQKGLLTVQEADELKSENEMDRTNYLNDMNTMSASKWKMSDSIKSMQLYGDMRFRYEYRGVDNAPGVVPNTYYRERGRYAFRVGLRGDLFDDFSYGFRVESANNPRSPWVTFGNNTTGGSVTPSDKNSSSLYIGQLYLNWHPESWYEMTIGRMPMPLYTTPMVWDSDINPEGAFEKFKYSAGPVDLFADFGQFVYQNPTSASTSPSGDTFLLAWQAGAQVNVNKNMYFKFAPTLYSYSGGGTSGGLNNTFVGQGLNGVNVGVPGGANVAGYNEEGINNLFIFELPAEFDFKINHTPLGALQARFFGDFAYNIEGDDRARAAYNANPGAFPALHSAATGNNIAYQVGFGIGSAGPTYGPTQGFVYGSAAKAGSWEARTYWQHVEQYSLDVNLLDSDFFEGRGNLQGVYAAFAYCFTDAIIGTVRYGYANRFNDNLGTGGNNLDIPTINPIKNYNLLQMDVTWKF